MASHHYNPEKRAWRGKSYKKSRKTKAGTNVIASIRDEDKVKNDPENAVKPEMLPESEVD